MKRRGTQSSGLAVMLAAAVAIGGRPAPAEAVLDTPGFRAVGVALSDYPISALTVAPDGRLFAAVQALGRPENPDDAARAEIRVYRTYSTGDGAILDEGSVWATLENVRATRSDDGLLGIALSPDFATSGLVYVYLTTTEQDGDQHVRVFRENASGTGDYLGAVATGLEPPEGSSGRNGGPLAFGVDGCLYLGIGDDGNGGRWNSQLLVGTDPIFGTEADGLCVDVCLGPTLYPERSIDDDGLPNHAGKILRLTVTGDSPVSGGPDAPFAAQPFAFAAGMRNPSGFAVHPLTGQLYVSEGGEASGEVGVVDSGSNQGWPCVEGSVAGSLLNSCLATSTPADVYANHPQWRRPITTHTQTNLTGSSAYTGLGYPAEYYGDVFYLLRNDARIYRIDLDPPCFLPHPNGVTPTVFHDSDEDGDFRVTLDADDDGEFETLGFPSLVALAQGPDPRGKEVLYVAGKRGNGGDDDTVIFRLEFATAYTPYAGPLGRVADACFNDGIYSGGSGTPLYSYENPFLRARCAQPPGPCMGQADGTPCGSGDPCNAGTCRAGVCDSSTGPPPLDVYGLNIKREVRGPGTGAIALRGSFRPAGVLAPESSDDVTVELRDAGGTVFSAFLVHPASDVFWKHPRPGKWRYRDRRGSVAGLTTMVLRQRASGAVDLTVLGRGLTLAGLDDPALNPRLVIGDQCFVADLTGRCTDGRRRMRCGR